MMSHEVEQTSLGLSGAVGVLLESLLQLATPQTCAKRRRTASVASQVSLTVCVSHALPLVTGVGNLAPCHHCPLLLSRYVCC